MISFQPTDEEVAFVEIADKFAREQIRPKMRISEAKEKISEKLIHNLTNLGFLTMEEPEEMGGLELPLTQQVQVHQSLAFGDLGIIQGISGFNDGKSFLRALTNKTKLKEKLRDESTIAYISSLTDQAFSTLKLENNQLTGKSLPIRLAKIATDFMIAIKDEEQTTHLVLIPYQSDKQAIEGQSYLGLINAEIGTVTFNEQIKENDIIAKGEEADEVIKQAEMRMHVLQAAKQVGLMQAAIEYATEYSATRKTFGQEIAKFQAVSFRISKMIIEKQVTENFVLEAASAIDNFDSLAYQKQLKTIHQAHRAVKYITDSAVQLLGGHGFVNEYPVEKWMRDAQAQVILYGNERGFKQLYGMELLGR